MNKNCFHNFASHGFFVMSKLNMLSDSNYLIECVCKVNKKSYSVYYLLVK